MSALAEPLSPPANGVEAATEVLASAVSAWNRGDFDGVLGFFDPEIVWFSLPGNPDFPAPVHGRAEVLDLIDEWLAPWSRYDVETLDVVRIGEAVLWTTRHIAAQERTGMTVEALMYAALTLRDGRIAEARYFMDRDEAVIAAGQMPPTFPAGGSTSSRR